MVETNWNQIVEYLDEYSGKKYRDPYKVPDVEKEYYSAFRRKGQIAREEYKRYCKAVCEAIPNLEMDSRSPNNWVNQGQKVNEYFWTKYKTSSHDDYINNIAITINKIPQLYDSWVLGVYVGLDNNKADDKHIAYKRQNHILDLDIPESNDLYYLVDSTYNTNRYMKNRDEVRREYDEHKVKSIQLVKIIYGPYTSDRSNAIIQDTESAIQEFIPYYEYIMRIMLMI